MSSRLRAISIAVTLLMICGVAGARDGLRAFANRKEGIRTSRDRSESEGVLSIHREPKAGLRPGEWLRLFVPSSSLSLSQAKVWEPATNYHMQPYMDGIGPGTCEGDPLRSGNWFCWPTDQVINPERVPLGDLFYRISDARDRFLPPFVTTDTAGSCAGAWNTIFAIVFSSTTDSVEWTIEFDSKGNTSLIAHGRRETSDEILRVAWNGSSEIGEAAPPGYYRFIVEAWVHRRSKNSRRVRYERVFQHASKCGNARVF